MMHYKRLMRTERRGLRPRMRLGALAQETVNVGYTGPLSGGAALYGRNTLGSRKWPRRKLFTANDAGGLEVGGKKYKFNIVALDDKYRRAKPP